MTSLTAFTVLVVLVGLERLAELVVSKRNAAWSFERGGVESGFSHYPPMVVLHTGLLVGALVEAYVREPHVPSALAWSMLLVVVLSQALRWWCITTLGPQWNTRVIVVPGMVPVAKGPYRIISHPNYVAVVLEGIALPLVHAAWITAVVFTLLNAVLLTVRIRVENAASPPWSPSMRDLVVAGGGPVGLATALYAARAGLDVEVREPRPGPVDKACGEGLMPGAVADLAALGVDPPGHRIAGIRYLGGGRTADAPFRHGEGRGVRRTALHRSLTDAVAGAGVTIVERAVGEVEHRDDHVLVDDEPARFLIAADGLHSPVRRMLGLDRPPEGRRRFGLRVHVEMAPWTPFVEVYWAEGSEAYVTPVADNLVGIAVLTELQAPFDQLLKEHPLIKERLERRPLSRTRGAGPLRQRSTARTQGRVLLVGDAAGYVDALTGEGIALGLAHARAAVDAVVAGRPEQYEAVYKKLGRRHELLTQALLSSSRVPAVRRSIVPLAARLPRVFAGVVDQLARPA